MYKVLIAVLVMAAVTYLPRVIPLILMRKEIKSKFVKSFLYYIPYTVLAAMTFPAIIYSTGKVSTGILGAGVAIVLSYFGKSLLQVSLITVSFVYILNIL